ncbi:hypothetical protein EIP86_009181 [Pleurotus ostreatoroseus]|nr:hypothetical protein EIP86_009181 [Pleurotus ostreatoroseus]
MNETEKTIMESIVGTGTVNNHAGVRCEQQVSHLFTISQGPTSRAPRVGIADAAQRVLHPWLPRSMELMGVGLHDNTDLGQTMPDQRPSPANHVDPQLPIVFTDVRHHFLPRFVIIPQRKYRATNQVEHFDQGPPIIFESIAANGVKTLGIDLAEVMQASLNKQPINNLVDDGDRPFERRLSDGTVVIAEKVTYRCERGITRTKIVMDVAQVLLAFFKERNHTLSFTKIEDLLLLHIEQVSPGSYQPVVAWKL